MNDNKTAHKRSKMPRSVRAKQFLPFAALKGFSEALYYKEKEHEIKILDKGDDRLFFDDMENVENS